MISYHQNETNSESKQANTAKPEGSIEKSTESSKTDEGEKVEEKCKSSEQLSDVKNDNENSIHTLGPDSSASVNKRDEQKTLDTVNTSAKPELQVPPVTTLPTEDSDDILKVHFIDVGQGDSILIHDQQFSILIDGGEQSCGSSIISYIKRLCINELDFVIATHPHDDHIGGLINVLKAIPVKTVLMPDVDCFTIQYDKFTELIQEKKIKVEFPSSGYKIEMLGSTAVILSPKQKFKNVNNNSIVVKLVHGDISFLFMGDAETDEELDLVNQGVDLKATVLKIGHHCSNTSSSGLLLRHVLPSKAVISVGAENIYGHPDDNTLLRIYKMCPEVYRTDKCGTISFTSNRKILLSNTLPCKYEKPSRVLPGFKFIGNSETKKLHLAECKFVPFKIKQTGFNSCNEAIKLGYTLCKKCKPSD